MCSNMNSTNTVKQALKLTSQAQAAAETAAPLPENIAIGMDKAQLATLLL